MSDTTGWGKCGVYSIRKTINGPTYTITPTGAEFVLSIGPLYGVATRPTLRECQILAHATARLWAGDTE